MKLRQNPKKKEVFTVDKQERGTNYFSQEIKKAYVKQSIKDRKPNKDSYYYQVKKHQEMHQNMTEEERQQLLSEIPQTDKHHTLNFLLKQKARLQEKQKLQDEYQKKKQEQQQKYLQERQQDRLQQKQYYQYQSQLLQQQQKQYFYTEKLPICKQCLKSFQTYQLLDRHVYYYHKENFQMTCLSCNEEFSKKRLFKEHMTNNPKCKKLQEKFEKCQKEARTYLGEEEDQPQPAQLNIHELNMVHLLNQQVISTKQQQFPIQQQPLKQQYMELNRIGNDSIIWAEKFDQNDFLEDLSGSDEENLIELLEQEENIHPNNNSSNNNTNLKQLRQEQKEQKKQKLLEQQNNQKNLTNTFSINQTNLENIQKLQKKQKKIKEANYWITGYFKNQQNNILDKFLKQEQQNQYNNDDNFNKEEEEQLSQE